MTPKEVHLSRKLDGLKYGVSKESVATKLLERELVIKPCLTAFLLRWSKS